MHSKFHVAIHRLHVQTRHIHREHNAPTSALHGSPRLYSTVNPLMHNEPLSHIAMIITLQNVPFGGEKVKQAPRLPQTTILPAASSDVRTDRTSNTLTLCTLVYSVILQTLYSGTASKQRCGRTATQTHRARALTEQKI